jgi:hypothetical protein
LLQQKYQQHASHRNEDGGRSLNDSNNKYPIWSVAVDAVALAAGVAATVITTFITFRKMIETGTS